MYDITNWEPDVKAFHFTKISSEPTTLLWYSFGITVRHFTAIETNESGKLVQQHVMMHVWKALLSTESK